MTLNAYVAGKGAKTLRTEVYSEATVCEKIFHWSMEKDCLFLISSVCALKENPDVFPATNVFLFPTIYFLPLSFSI